MATPSQLSMYRAQIAVGNCFALRDGFGVAVVCGGFVQVDEQQPNVAQAWFIVNQHRAKSIMADVISGIALTMRQQPYAGLSVEIGTRAGRIIARRLGFKFQSENSMHEVWTWTM